MSDIGQALNEGAEFARGLTADERKTAAYNALASTYGVALAGDPDTALKAQTYGQREKTNPIEVQQAGANLTGTNLDNTGKQQTNDYNALANPKKLVGLDLTNENTQATTANTQAQTNETNTLLPGKVSQQGATLKQTNAQTGLTNAETAKTGVETQQSRLALNTAQAAQDRQGAMGLLASLSDTAATGGDIGGKFDEMAPLIAKYEGVDPSHMAPLRAQLVKDPIGTINRLTDAINAAQTAALGGSGKAAGLATMVKLGNQQMGLKDGLTLMQSRVEGAQEIADTMTTLLPQMSELPTVAKAKALIPGTPEYQFHQLADQLRSNLSLNDLQAMKNTGLSMGRVTNAEMAAAGNALANLDIGLPKATLVANLKRANGTFKITADNLAGDLKRVGNGGLGAGHVAPKFQAGQVYTDAGGNKATFNANGTWTPVK